MWLVFSHWLWLCLGISRKRTQVFIDTAIQPDVISAFCEGNSPITTWIPSQRTSNAGLWCLLWCYTNKHLHKRTSCRWFETLQRSCDLSVMGGWEITQSSGEAIDITAGNFHIGGTIFSANWLVAGLLLSTLDLWNMINAQYDVSFCTHPPHILAILTLIYTLFPISLPRNIIRNRFQIHIYFDWLISTCGILRHQLLGERYNANCVVSQFSLSKRSYRTNNTFSRRCYLVNKYHWYIFFLIYRIYFILLVYNWAIESDKS